MAVGSLLGAMRGGDLSSNRLGPRDAPSSSDGGVRAPLAAAIRSLYVLGSISVAVLGLSWLIAHASVVPKSGDTFEYLALARTLQVDQYRTVLYPGILKLSGVLRNGPDEPFTGVTYAVQMGALVASTAIFVAALASGLGLFHSGHGHPPSWCSPRSPSWSPIRSSPTSPFPS